MRAEVQRQGQGMFGENKADIETSFRFARSLSSGARAQR
jgi:hypothetical protein